MQALTDKPRATSSLAPVAKPPVIRFTLPKQLEATGSPEQRGLRRDHVRLMVLDRRSGAVTHTRFDRIGDFLCAGDLLVVNDSRTIPALLPGTTEGGAAIEVRLARPLTEDSGLRTQDSAGDGPHPRPLSQARARGEAREGEYDLPLPLKEGEGRGEGRPDTRPPPYAERLTDHEGAEWEALLLPHGGEHAGQRIDFAAGLSATVIERRADLPWLWRLRFNTSGLDLLERIYRAGEPVRYTYVPEALPIDLYQTVYAREPGSVEMPSAGRPLSWELLQNLRRRRIGLAFITLHTGLSSFRDPVADSLRPSHEEPYRITAAAAAAMNAARACGGRVIAVGTTVVRTLETVADASGRVEAAEGVTDLYISQAHRLRAVDGLLTGLHEPEASHLDLLSAFVRPELLGPAYDEALTSGYLWHEFGDTNLIL